MEYYSRNKKPETIPAPECSEVIPEFQIQTNKNGKTELVKQERGTNIYEKIQAGKESTMIDNIIKRFYEGDTSVLEKMKGQFGDITNMPKTLTEAQQRIVDAEKFFNDQPIEFRQKFGMDPGQFLAAAGNGKLNEILGIQEEKLQTPEEIIKKLKEENSKLKEKEGFNE